MPESFSMGEHIHIETDAVTKEYVNLMAQNQIATTLGILDNATTLEYTDFTTVGDSGSTFDISATRATVNGEQIATIQDLDDRRFRYLGYEKHEHGIITRERKLQQRVQQYDGNGQYIYVWEDIPTVEE